jgi:serine protease
LPPNDEWLRNLSGSAGSTTEYFYNVPSGVTGVRVQMRSGTGDADLFVKWDDDSDWACIPENNDNFETCGVAKLRPLGNTLKVTVLGYDDYAGARIRVRNT